jgi:hypothetical protein
MAARSRKAAHVHQRRDLELLEQGEELGPRARSLAGVGIGYAHEPDLGGRRDPSPDSVNTAWRVAAFRGYADHMASPDFRAALERVVASSEAGRPVECRAKTAQVGLKDTDVN